MLDANAPDLEPAGSATTSSAEICVASERAREVRSALAQLSEEQRQVLRLAFFEGMTQAEIAEVLEEPLGTIKARAQRGMARLRTLWGGSMSNPEDPSRLEELAALHAVNQLDEAGERNCSRPRNSIPSSRR